MGVFRFKQFEVDDHGCGMKICSDSVLLAAWFLEPYKDARSVLDAGAGSGLLALMAALICGDAEVTAVELDKAAAQAAEVNFDNSPWRYRLRLLCCDYSSYCPAVPHDLIISNPPYFTNGVLSPDMARRAARHQKGLTFESLLASPLAAGGHLGMVTPAAAYDDVIFQAAMHRRYPARICKVVTSPGKEATRLLWDFADVECPLREEILELRDSDGLYSEEYRKIVEPYYLKLSVR